jgi:hypothetical protein
MILFHAVLPGLNMRRNISVSDGNEATSAIINIYATHFNRLMEKVKNKIKKGRTEIRERNGEINKINDRKPKMCTAWYKYYS